MELVSLEDPGLFELLKAQERDFEASIEGIQRCIDASFRGRSQHGNLCYSMIRIPVHRPHSHWMAKDIVERFAERIKTVREQKKITQVALAEKIGIQSTYLSDLENAKKEPCLRVLELLSTGLETSLSKLFQDL
jgi:ribosome-binding protein aMBF1 (putative translation factor)